MSDLLLSLIALIPSCGWLLDRQRHRQEVRQLKADASQKEFDLSAQYVKEFRDNICAPLQDEVRQLRAAIEAVNTCPHRTHCPVIDKLHSPQQGPSPTPGN